MLIGTRRSALNPGRTYMDRVKGIQSADLIGYWPMNERRGAVAVDWSKEKNNGAYTGATLGNAPGPDLSPSPHFDGSNDFNNIYSVGFRDDFNGKEGTVGGWFRVDSASVWTDSAYRDMVHLYVDANNHVRMYKGSTNNQFNFIYKANGTQELVSRTISPTAWTHAAITWSLSTGANGEMRAYIDGVQVGSTQTNLGTWAGNLLNGFTLVGANRDTVPFNAWHGLLSHPVTFKVALSPAKIANLATL